MTQGIWYASIHNNTAFNRIVSWVNHPDSSMHHDAHNNPTLFTHGVKYVLCKVNFNAQENKFY